MYTRFLEKFKLCKHLFKSFSLFNRIFCYFIIFAKLSWSSLKNNLNSKKINFLNIYIENCLMDTC